MRVGTIDKSRRLTLPSHTQHKVLPARKRKEIDMELNLCSDCNNNLSVVVKSLTTGNIYCVHCGALVEIKYIWDFSKKGDYVGELNENL